MKINNIENLKKRVEWKLKKTHTHKTHRYVGLLLHKGTTEACFCAKEKDLEEREMEAGS